jgi:hypothetical protein
VRDGERHPVAGRWERAGGGDAFPARLGDERGQVAGAVSSPTTPSRSAWCSPASPIGSFSMVGARAGRPVALTPARDFLDTPFARFVDSIRLSSDREGSTMSSTTSSVTLALLALLSVPRLLAGDVIHLRNGNSVEVQSWRRAGDSIEYYRFGGLVSIPSSQVLRIEGPRTEPAPAPDPAPVSATFQGAATAHMLDRALRALSAGDVEAFVTYFRYVDDPKWPNERPALTRVFSLLRDRLGRPDGFEAVDTTASRFVNILIESATPDEWQRSDCQFKGYAFRSALVEGKVRRPVEAIIEVCQARTATRNWLRKVDIHFLEPDPKVVRILEDIAQAMQAGAPRPR